MPDNTKMRRCSASRRRFRCARAPSSRWSGSARSKTADAAPRLKVALKIDVDTHQGLGLGVPRLAAMLKREGITASFYITMGPDNSGRAIIRVIRNRGFLSKMFRTKAVSMYGLRTVLSGTLLPSRPIALAYPEVMRDLQTLGLRSRRPWLRSCPMAGSARSHRRRRNPQRTRRRVRGLSRDHGALGTQLRRTRMAH